MNGCMRCGDNKMLNYYCEKCGMLGFSKGPNGAWVANTGDVVKVVQAGGVKNGCPTCGGKVTEREENFCVWCKPEEEK